jgi:predicted transcriptional regulator
MEHQIENLTELGLSGYEAAVYLALLARGGMTPSELSTRARIPRQRIYDVLESLTAKGLCTGRDTTPKTYFGGDPSLVLESLSQRRALELERERERTARRVHDLIAELAPVFEAGRDQNDPLSYIEVLGDTGRIAARALELARSAESCVNSCIKRPLILSPEQNWRFLREPLSHGVLYRAVYERSALEDAELRDWMTTLNGWGQQIRIAEELPIKMQAFDEDAALLSMQDPVGGPPSFTALVIRHRGTVAFLNMAFERLWQQSEPFDR